MENVSQATKGRYPTGLIGIGLMGTAIATRLGEAHLDVLGWDVAFANRAPLNSLSVTPASNADEVFTTCQQIVLSLPNDSVVREVIEGAESQLRAGQQIIDTSTGNPDAARQRAIWLEVRGVGYLDATVSGSSSQMRSGEAVLFVGGSEPSFQAVKELLHYLSINVHYLGPVGSGSQMKLVSNLVLGLNRAALAEGLIYAQSMGLDLETTLQLLKESMAYSRIMDTKGDKMIRRDFVPQAKLEQHLKDVELMLESSQKFATDLPLTRTHQQLLEQAMKMGLGELDNSAIIEVFRSSAHRKAHL